MLLKEADPRPGDELSGLRTIRERRASHPRAPPSSPYWRSKPDSWLNTKYRKPSLPLPLFYPPSHFSPPLLHPKFPTFYFYHYPSLALSLFSNELIRTDNLFFEKSTHFFTLLFWSFSLNIARLLARKFGCDKNINMNGLKNVFTGFVKSR